MIHKGIEYEIAKVGPGLWKYQFCIGAVIRTGKAKCSLELLAERRVRQKIDRLLRTPPLVRTRRSRRMATVLALDTSRGTPTARPPSGGD